MNTFWRLLRLHRPQSLWLSLGLLLSLLTLLANVVLMTTSGWFIAAMGLAGTAGVSINYFTPAAIIRGCAIVRTTGRYGERLVTHDATLRLLSGLRLWIYQALEPQAPAGLEHDRSGRLLTRLTADIDILDNFYLRILLPGSVAFIACCIFIGWLWFQSPQLALAQAALLLLAGWIFPWLLSHAGGFAARQTRELQEQLRTEAGDAFQGLAELLLYGAADAQADRLARISTAFGTTQLRAGRWAHAAESLVSLGAWLTLWSLVVLVAPEIETGHRPPAELAMFALFALASFEAVTPMPMAFLSLGPTLSAARQLFALADRPPVVSEPLSGQNRPSRYDYDFDAVGFHYPGSREAALQDICLNLAAGSSTAIIGPSGSGKTTLLRLMLRFYLPTQGQLRIGGHDIRTCSGTAIRQQLAVADQHSHLFIGSLRQNLLLARPDASDDALRQACETALLWPWIESLPDGLDTQIGEASLRISGGESRRLTLARALLREAPVLILDEPGEGLDPATARNLLLGIMEKYRQRTLVLITHQLDQLPLVDQIVLLDQGRILAQGNHQQLLKSSEAYQRLMALSPIVTV